MADSTIALIILICMVALFCLDKLPIGLTSVLGVLALAFFGVIRFEEVFIGFSDNTVMLVFGAIVLGNTLTETGCTKLLGDKIASLKFLMANERLMMLAIMVITTLLSLFISNTATVAMMLPVVSTICAASKGRFHKKNIVMAVGVAAVLGGNVTLTGSTPQIVAQGILGNTEGVRVMTYFELARGALPMIAIMLVYYCTIGYSIQKKVLDYSTGAEAAAAEGQGGEGVQANKVKVWLSIAIFCACTVGFVTGFTTFGVVSVSGACLCVLTGCIKPKRIWETMDWRTIVVLGSALGFAHGMDKSGLPAIMAETVLRVFGGASFHVIGAVLLVTSSVVSILMSNTATVAVIAPVSIALAVQMGIDPVPFLVMVIIGSGLDFVTPLGTPPMTMTLSAGYRFTDYVKITGLLILLLVFGAALVIPLLYGI